MSDFRLYITSVCFVLFLHTHTHTMWCAYAILKKMLFSSTRLRHALQLQKLRKIVNFIWFSVLSFFLLSPSMLCGKPLYATPQTGQYKLWIDKQKCTEAAAKCGQFNVWWLEVSLQIAATKITSFSFISNQFLFFFLIQARRILYGWRQQQNEN